MYQIKVEFEPLLPAGEPMTEAEWKTTGQIAKQEIALGMDEQVQVNGAGYPPLKPKTVERKRKKGSTTPEKRLLDTHNMRNSPQMVPDKTGVSLFFGTQREQIAPYHQFGTENLPAVNFFGISERARKRILDYWITVVDQWLRKTR